MSERLDNSRDEKIQKLLLELDLLKAGQSFVAQSLTGGVSSEIYKVTTEKRDYCVKFALAQLKVEQEWFAPVERNQAEYRWLSFVGAHFPQDAPKLYGHSEKLLGFAMEYLDGEAFYLWKAQLLTQKPDDADARIVARLLGQIHQQSTKTPGIKEQFQNHAQFWDLRLEPYLQATAKRHPKLAAEFDAMLEALQNSNVALIHGDVSPKNIFIARDQHHAVILDAECATMGDPVFDLAFCLNHLLLKSRHRAEYRAELLAMAELFWQNYAPFISWEEGEEFEARLCRLLPMLMLARIDGKSPIEYLSDNAREDVRDFSNVLIQNPPKTLNALLTQLKDSMGAKN